jgi:glycosyltransferase involved in cell wall biosynthesis
MRILVHDYAGHPFQIELSRELARRGHDVVHAYCASIPTTAHGKMARQPDDPPSLDVRPLRLKKPLEKYAYLTRWRQEREYGKLVATLVAEVAPEVVLSGNTPLDAQRRLMKTCRSRGIRFVFWVQDLLSLATERVLAGRFGVPGRLVGRYYVSQEARMLRASDAVVLITGDFGSILRDWGVAPERTRVIENWGAIESLPVHPADNDWQRRSGIDAPMRFLYAGNLGMKHNPELLLRLAEENCDAALILVSEGLGADWLRDQADRRGLSNIHIVGFQPFDAFPEVLASGHVLVGLLEPDAGVFSVPSKVLSYLCAGRPVLLAVPRENLAARLVEREGAGIVVDPSDAEGFVVAANRLRSDPGLRKRMGAAGRAYAERAFPIDRVASKFEDVLSGREQALAKRS